jgi:hypothetical protein
MAKNTLLTRDSMAPLFSSASTVLVKSGAAV